MESLFPDSVVVEMANYNSPFLTVYQQIEYNGDIYICDHRDNYSNSLKSLNTSENEEFSTRFQTLQRQYLYPRCIKSMFTHIQQRSNVTEVLVSVTRDNNSIFFIHCEKIGRKEKNQTCQLLVVLLL